MIHGKFHTKYFLWVSLEISLSFAYEGGNTLVAMTNGVTTTTTYYDAGPVQGVASNGGAVSFLVRDGTGSVVRALAADGSPAGMTLYTPYGASQYQAPGMPMPTHLGYQGQYTDPNTGLLTGKGTGAYDPSAAQNTVTGGGMSTSTTSGASNASAPVYVPQPLAQGGNPLAAQIGAVNATTVGDVGGGGTYDASFYNSNAQLPQDDYPCLNQVCAINNNADGYGSANSQSQWVGSSLRHDAVVNELYRYLRLLSYIARLLTGKVLPVCHDVMGAHDNSCYFPAKNKLPGHRADDIIYTNGKKTAGYLWEIKPISHSLEGNPFFYQEAKDQLNGTIAIAAQYGVTLPPAPIYIPDAPGIFGHVVGIQSNDLPVGQNLIAAMSTILGPSGLVYYWLRNASPPNSSSSPSNPCAPVLIAIIGTCEPGVELPDPFGM